MTKKITFPRWPSEFPANLCRPVCLGGLTGRHWLAGNSEGHRGISKFLFLMVPYNYYGALATGIREVAFFYHLKTQSYIVLCMIEILSLKLTISIINTHITGVTLGISIHGFTTIQETDFISNLKSFLE